MLDTS